LDDGSAQQPLVGEIMATAVGGFFFEAGRFQDRQFTQGVQHLREARAKKGQENSGK
jgi:hypothetical protein